MNSLIARVHIVGIRGYNYHLPMQKLHMARVIGINCSSRVAGRLKTNTKRDFSTEEFSLIRFQLHLIINDHLRATNEGIQGT